jgi:hypothetical protein
MFELKCPECGLVVRLDTGVSFCLPHHEPWQFEQWVCAACPKIVSVPDYSCGCERESVCPDCSGPLERWAGAVWFEERPGFEDKVERVGGPCPACGAKISEEDTTGFMGLWD